MVLLLPAILALSLNSSVREPQKNTNFQSQQWNMHIAVAFSEAHAQTFSRAFNKMMNNVTRLFMDNYHQHNITLSPLIIPLPENEQFSAAILEKTCGLLEGKHIVAVLIIGGSPAGFAVALAAGTAGIPVLWARGGTGDLVGYFQSVSTIVLFIH
jgi:ionotropic glutamate receptor NMDA 3A